MHQKVLVNHTYYYLLLTKPKPRCSDAVVSLYKLFIVCNAYSDIRLSHNLKSCIDIFFNKSINQTNKDQHSKSYYCDFMMICGNSWILSLIAHLAILLLTKPKELRRLTLNKHSDSIVPEDILSNLIKKKTK